MRSQISFDKETHPQRLARSPKSKVKNGQALKVNGRVGDVDINKFPTWAHNTEM